MTCVLQGPQKTENCYPQVAPNDLFDVKIILNNLHSCLLDDSGLLDNIEPI